LPTRAKLVADAVSGWGRASVTVTRTEKTPTRRYRCVPLIVNVPFDPLTVPEPVDPSPQLMVAAKRAAPVAALASVNVATTWLDPEFLARKRTTGWALSTSGGVRVRALAVALGAELPGSDAAMTQ
jgi:hypothetical protein